MPALLSFQEAASKVKASYPNLKLLTFSNTKGPATIFCRTHKVTRTYACYGTIRGCPDCAKEKWRVAHSPKTHSSYVRAVSKGTSHTIKVVGEYVNAHTKIEHLCARCGTTLLVQPRSMLTHFGCKNCSLASGEATGSQYREVKLGRRTVRVQGNGEVEALGFLTSVLKIKPTNILVGSEGSIPGIYYHLKGRERMYRPDFLLRKENRIVEVKSTWYFGLTRKDVYGSLVAKAKACISQGYDFRVLICNLYHRGPILLPKNWYTYTHKQFQRMWVDKYKLTLTGALCTG